MIKKLILIGSILLVSQTLANNKATDKVNVLGVHESQVEIFNINESEYKLRDFKSMLKAAQSRDIAAQVKVADLLYFGNDLVSNEKEALHWWHRAATSHNNRCKSSWQAKACFRLAKYYFNKDRKKSIQLFAHAARLGHSESQMTLYMLRKNQNKSAQGGKYA